MPAFLVNMGFRMAVDNDTEKKKVLKPKKERIEYSEFFEQLEIEPSKVKLLEQYHWILSEDELRKLKDSTGNTIWCGENMVYHKETIVIKFRIGASRKSTGSTKTAFIFDILEAESFGHWWFDAKVNRFYSIMLENWAI